MAADYPTEKIRNVVLLGHSHDGKTALAEAMPERYHIMVLTQAGLGLRIGELLATLTRFSAEAIAREKRVKTWRRAWKYELIERMNEDWADLYPSLNS